MQTHAFSVDMEDWYQGLELPLSAWRNFEQRLEKGLHVLLGLLDTAGVSATFFVLGRVAETHPHLVRAVHASGHEIGSHGYQHERIDSLDPALFREQETRTKGLLEDLTGESVTGFRAPFFSVSRGSLWALEVLAALGYRYDCSISPVVTWRYGIQGAPEGIYDIDGLGLTEFPVSTWSLFGRRMASGGAFFRIFPSRWTQRPFLRRRPGMFYIHPWEYDPGHPKTRFGIRAMATHYANLGGTERRTRALLRTAAFAPVRSVIAAAREAGLVRACSLEALASAPLTGASGSTPQ